MDTNVNLNDKLQAERSPNRVVFFSACLIDSGEGLELPVAPVCFRFFPVSFRVMLSGVLHLMFTG